MLIGDVCIGSADGSAAGARPIARVDSGQDRWERSLTPCRSANAEGSAETTSRCVARAVAAMMRSWASRGLPCRRVMTSSSAWEPATVESKSMMGMVSKTSSTNCRRAATWLRFASATPTRSSAMVIVATATSSSSSTTSSREDPERSASTRDVVSSRIRLRVGSRSPKAPGPRRHPERSSDLADGVEAWP